MAVAEGKLKSLVFTCKGGNWDNTGVVCPDEYSYFCKVGSHAIGIGERLMLGSGPAHLECKFPGILAVVDEPAAPSVASSNSRSVKSVQHHLSRENAGINCAADPCVGQMDDKTLAAMAAFVRDNFSALQEPERTALGITSAEDAERVLLGKSPIDFVPVFITIFDVPNVD